ncbi:MAG: cardiolipin synthase [Deltaproteobacteria bacterium]|nr:cardiolipin synthase [Deltaproteobacteria bacterium]MBW2658155.1 cardiolipin synthase [Deltaproteobacteria bacterium]
MDAIDPHWSYSFFSAVILLADFFIRICLSLRVVMRKRPYGVSLAWLVVILLIPFIGGFLYLFFGENRISEKRIKKSLMASSYYQQWLKTLRDRAPISWQGLNSECEPLHRQAETLVGIPAMSGNMLHLIDQPEDILSSILEDIRTSQSTCHLQFYIWEEGGRVDKIAEALIQAASRGVICRILLDSIGSRKFLKSKTATAMKNGGIRIEESLPAGIVRLFFSRIDIRNHRKIVVIDGEIAYTGSQNMVDPEVFKKDAGVGNWIDIMVKVEGPVVEILAGTFVSDWFLETDIDRFRTTFLQDDIKSIREIGDIHPRPARGNSAVQIVPSGPEFVPEAIHSLLLTTIYAARNELIMTTPYFIPDEPLLAALKAAAQRGVEVIIIIPEKNDSILVKYASRGRYEDLAASGVKLFLFRGGLLHSKTVTVDRDFSLLGSVNLDMRSFWLNFEATLFIYCRDFTRELLEIQLGYLKQSKQLDIAQFSQRGVIKKFKENLSLLVSPLL